MAGDVDTAARVSIDYALCAGHGRCYEVAPALFDSDDDGHGQVTAVDVTGEDRALAERVAGLCPELAVRVEGGSASDPA
jgi:ferredoxin